MATTYLYGPYYVIEGPDTPFRPGEVRSYGFGPWRPFRRRDGHHFGQYPGLRPAL